MTLAHDSRTADAGPSGEHRIGLRRLFTSPGIDPFDEVVWELGDARITNFRDGTVAFEQLGVVVAERPQHRRPEVLPRHARQSRPRVVVAAGGGAHRRHDHAMGA